MKHSFTLLCAVMLFAQSSLAQLPKGFTPAEEAQMKAGDFSLGGSRGITTPPTGVLRTMAEWEEIQTLVVTYTGYPSIVRQIIDYAQEECEVLVACTDSNAVKSALASAGIPLTNVSFLEVPFNSIWIRDYGGHTVYKNDVDSIMLVDWIYNRPTRPLDNAMPDEHGAFKGIPVYATTAAPYDLVNTGGNWMVDGFGTAFASELILEENEPGNSYGVTAKTEADIDTIMKKFMGITRYIKMPTLPYDNIHHIDMHMKLLDEETLLWSEYPVGESDGPQIEANLAYVNSTYNSVFGTPYKIIRIPAPPSTAGLYPADGGSYRTYANNVFVNKTLIVPGYRTEYDTIAERILSEALPGYKIKFIDVDNTGANLISQSGAIHCITNAIGVNDPLLIKHQSLTDTYDDVNPYIVEAWIKHRSGISSATLYYSTNGGSTYTAVPMGTFGGPNYAAAIPAQPIGTEVLYYIQAQSVSGKQQVRPIVAPDGYFHFKVLGALNTDNQVVSTAAFNVFPNPAGSLTCVDISMPQPGRAVVSLRNVLSQVTNIVYDGQADGNKKVFFDASMFTPGLYLVQVTTAKGTQVQKLVIK